MCDTMRLYPTQFLSILALLTLVITLPSAAAVIGHNETGGDVSITGDSSIVDTMAIETVDSQCASGDEQHLERIGSKEVAHGIQVLLRGTVSAPNPCAQLNATVVDKGASSAINLTTTSGDGFCVECVGSLTFTANVTLSETGNVSLVYAGEQLGEIVANQDAVTVHTHSSSERSTRERKQHQDNTSAETPPQNASERNTTTPPVQETQEYRFGDDVLKVKPVKNTCRSGESIDDVTSSRVDTTDSGYSIQITGQIDPTSACSTLLSNVTQDGDRYVVDLATRSTDEGCVACVGQLTYRIHGSLADTVSAIVVQHGGEEMERVTVASRQPETNIVDTVMSIIRRIFGLR